MAIVKMKRLRLLGLQSDRDRLFRLLQDLGCVEIGEAPLDLSDPQWAALTKPDTAALTRARARKELLDHALATARKHAPPKSEKGGLLSPRPQLTRQALFDDAAYDEALSLAREIRDGERALAELSSERGKLLTQKAALAPWLSLDVPLELEHTERTALIPAAVPLRADLAAVEAAAAEVTDLFQLFPAGRDRELQYFLLLCHSSAAGPCLEAMRPFGCTQVNLRGWTGAAQDNDAALDNRLAALDGQIDQAEQRLAAFAPRMDSLRRAIDRTAQDIAREEARERLVDTETAFFLDGWLPAEDEAKVAQALSPLTCAWEMTDPEQTDYPQVPIKLKNNLVTRCMNTITEMYSLPAYDGIDPNPLMAPFFILFFGMMMADMAYGLLMIAGTAVFLKKARPKNPGFMEMIFWCGISTFIWGALTGGFLGDFIPQLIKLFNPASTFAMPALFTPLTDTIAILAGSLVLGVIQVFTGMAVGVYRKCRDGEFIDALFDEITWWIIIAGLALFMVGKLLPGLPSVLGTIGVTVLIVGVLMLFVGGTRNNKGFGKVTGFVGLVYNGVSGYFSDILSYLRLMALMLAGSVIAQVFNTLASVVGGMVPVVGIVLFFLISLLGNAINLALNLLGCYVHDLRLQCLEFFNRFYKGGGKPFKPLTIDTNYVEIMKEEH